MKDASADYSPSTDSHDSFADIPEHAENEMLLNSSMQIGTNALNYGSDRNQPATVKNCRRNP
jgi:hypothetical protein